MSWLRRRLDALAPEFARGGRFSRYQAAYQMIDKTFFTPADVSRVAPHVRDGIDLKRVMSYVVLAVTPCAVVGMWNTGHQANQAMLALGVTAASGWRGFVLNALGVGYDPGSVLACLVHGFVYFAPIYLVALAVGTAWELLVAAVRNHEVNEGIAVTAILFALTLPATIPLWQVALGISFGVVIGKEIFGGTGKNFVNPALAGRAFLFFAYPAALSGDSVWTAVDGFTGATPLALAATGGLPALLDAGVTWQRAFLGQVQGALGATSTLACLLGGTFLMLTRIASWRIVAGVMAGMVITVLLLNAFGSGDSTLTLPWYWHLVLGGFAFGMMFMATDPVTAAQTNAGRWLFGALVGFMTILIRVANPASPEGIMLAILFANLVAPLIDYLVVRLAMRRRGRRMRA
jgi:Na+-transporting NADH:ubiquinone oxidoreductase subunit B